MPIMPNKTTEEILNEQKKNSDISNYLYSKIKKGLSHPSNFRPLYQNSTMPDPLDSIQTYGSQPTPVPTTATLPVDQVTSEYTPLNGLNIDNALPMSDSLDYKPQDFSNPFSTEALNNKTQQETAQSLLPNSQTQQPKTNILGEPVPMDKLPKGVGYVNGKLYDSNTQSPQGMFVGYSKERDAAINQYGKVDKNSDFYKRNKLAMSNL